MPASASPAEPLQPLLAQRTGCVEGATAAAISPSAYLHAAAFRCFSACYHPELADQTTRIFTAEI